MCRYLLSHVGSANEITPFGLGRWTINRCETRCAVLMAITLASFEHYRHTMTADPSRLFKVWRREETMFPLPDSASSLSVPCKFVPWPILRAHQPIRRPLPRCSPRVGIPIRWSVSWDEIKRNQIGREGLGVVDYGGIKGTSNLL